MLREKVLDPEFSDFFQTLTTAAPRNNVLILFTNEHEQIGVNATVWQNSYTLVDTAVKQAILGQVRLKNNPPAGTELFGEPLIS